MANPLFDLDNNSPRADLAAAPAAEVFEVADQGPGDHAGDRTPGGAVDVGATSADWKKNLRYNAMWCVWEV
jgi:hypothetical protein